MINKNFVIEKVNLMTAGLEQLAGFSKMTLVEIAGDYIKYSALKNILMETIGRAIDINEYLITQLADPKIEAPKTYRDGFLAMGKFGILPPDFAQEIAKSAGFRNAIVHEYNNLDKSGVYETVGQAIDQYNKYCELVMRYINSVE